MAQPLHSINKSLKTPAKPKILFAEFPKHSRGLSDTFHLFSRVATVLETVFKHILHASEILDDCFRESVSYVIMDQLHYVSTKQKRATEKIKLKTN